MEFKRAIPSGSRFTMTEDAEMPWGIIGKILDALLSAMVGKNIEKIYRVILRIF